jgi:hypothetical protein
LPGQSNSRLSFSGWVATGQDLVAMLRDAALLLMAILLIGWPNTINQILSDAGFEEGSIAGLKWKKHLEQSDDSLVKAKSIIADLRHQNDTLSKVISDLKNYTSNTELKEKIKNIEQLNTQVVASVDKAKSSVEANISSNSPLVQNIHTSTGSVITWGVVFGGDQNIDAAKYEAETVAPT